MTFVLSAEIAAGVNALAMTGGSSGLLVIARKLVSEAIPAMRKEQKLYPLHA